MIEVKKVESIDDIKRFVKFPFYIYKNSKYWVPPIINDEINTLRNDKNPAYKFSDAEFYLFKRGKDIVGRVGLIINKNKEKEKEFARITRIDFIEDYNVAKFIFDFSKEWAKKNGKNFIHGPLGFTNFDTQGLLVEGFNKLPTVASSYNYEYYKVFFENYGFKKEIDWVEYEINVPDKIPEKVLKIGDIITKRYKVKTVQLKSKKDLMKYAREVFDLINESYSELFSAITLNDELINKYIDDYIKKIEPDLVKLAINEKGNVIAFVISMPSLSKALQKAKGKLFPFGFIHILKALKYYDKLDLYLGAVDPSYQGKGLPALLMIEMTKTAIKKKIKKVETNSELEINSKVQSTWKYFDSKIIKRKRSYILQID